MQCARLPTLSRKGLRYPLTMAARMRGSSAAANSVAGNADDGRRRRGRLLREQEVREHADAGPAVEHDLLARVCRERALLERQRTKRLARYLRAAAASARQVGGESDELRDLRSKRL